jgi:hypothetical protein
MVQYNVRRDRSSRRLRKEGGARLLTTKYCKLGNRVGGLALESSCMSPALNSKAVTSKAPTSREKGKIELPSIRSATAQER